MTLTPCRRCARHVRIEDAACPFCGSTVERASPRMTRDLAGLSRAALVLAGAAALGACGKEQGGPRDNTSIAAPYGAPPLPEDATAPPPLPRDAGTGTK